MHFASFPLIKVFNRTEGMTALRNLILVCFSTCFCVNASSEIIYKEVRVTGYGLNVSEAVVDALENAISQVNGQRLTTSTSLRISAGQQDGVDKLDESFQRNIQKATRGVVKSYTIHESGLDNDGRAFAKLAATIPFYNSSNQLKRLRLALAPMVIEANSKNDPNARRFSNAVSSALETHLTQTRKFAVLDRRNADATSRELQLALGGKSAIEESVRGGLRAVADYLVVLSLRDFAYQSTPQRRLSGRVVERTRAPFGMDLRVVDITSGQVKFAQTYQHSGFIPLGHGLDRLALDVAGNVGEEINFAIYPVAVVATLGSGEYTLNQGGQTLQIDRLYRLIHLGLNLTDPYTRESLGQQEREVGRIEIVSVTDKTSTARLISGVPPANFKPGTLIIRPSSEEFFGKDAESATNSHFNSNSPIGAGPTKTPLTGGTKRLSDDW
jgi:curli biogenesis system outer membrane secretion channel CsgG